MDLNVIDDRGQKTATFDASDALFGHDYNEALVHQVVMAYQANARLGTRAQKDRSEVTKSTASRGAQKGTGRARAGQASSPLWRGGGKIFAVGPDENFSQKVNRKMYRAGMASILSQLAREDAAAVVDDFTLEAPKTKLFAQKMKGSGSTAPCWSSPTKLDENLLLSSRNLPNVMVLRDARGRSGGLVRFNHVLLTRGAVTKFEEMLE